ncbi:YeiH family protein [Arthrobacter woluwensis]|uniref:YeiH family protein n=1 Tax=Arthrobacter woluwensis TaxID=156980 RepID=UPI001AAF4D94|nr:putative sulfate exporter family transporter [Arthrobacter woluwensis]QTF71459.1 putative sulfate exporter family transporter [Arthrobacter woluwensis]
MPTALQRPGLLLAGAVALVACVISHLAPGVSALLIAIIVGVVARNAGILPRTSDPGLGYAARVPLRLGIVLLGLQLSLPELFARGWGVPVLAVLVVGVGIVGTLGLGRLLGVERRQALLVACGFSICGAAAVAGVESSVDAREKETVTAVALVVLFGTLMIPLIPGLGALLGLSTDQTALWAGASVHEVGQVVAIGGLLGGGALGLAVSMKLARVLLLAPVAAVLGARSRALTPEGDVSQDSASSKPPVIPLFLVGFIIAAVVRSLLPVPHEVLALASSAQEFLLSAAMFALGAGVHVKSLLSGSGRLLALAAGSTVLVAALGLGGALVIA